MHAVPPARAAVPPQMPAKPRANVAGAGKKPAATPSLPNATAFGDFHPPIDMSAELTRLVRHFRNIATALGEPSQKVRLKKKALKDLQSRVNNNAELYPLLSALQKRAPSLFTGLNGWQRDFLYPHASALQWNSGSAGGGETIVASAAAASPLRTMPPSAGSTSRTVFDFEKHPIHYAQFKTRRDACTYAFQDDTTLNIARQANQRGDNAGIVVTQNHDGPGNSCPQNNHTAVVLNGHDANALFVSVYSPQLDPSAPENFNLNLLTCYETALKTVLSVYGNAPKKLTVVLPLLSSGMSGGHNTAELSFRALRTALLTHTAAPKRLGQYFDRVILATR